MLESQACRTKRITIASFLRGVRRHPALFVSTETTRCLQRACALYALAEQLQKGNKMTVKSVLALNPAEFITDAFYYKGSRRIISRNIPHYPYTFPQKINFLATKEAEQLARPLL
jgi:hypothetical protein